MGIEGSRFVPLPTACIKLRIDSVRSTGEVGDDFCVWQRSAEFGVERSGESAIDFVSSTGEVGDDF
jgi:hypothetical protein